MTSISSFLRVCRTLNEEVLQWSFCTAGAEMLVMFDSVNTCNRSTLNWFCCWFASVWIISMAFTRHALRRKWYRRKKSATRKISKKIPHTTRKDTDVLDAMHWWVTKKKPLKLDRSCACSGQLNCDPVYGDNEQPLPQGLVFRKWKDPGDKVDPVSDETCPHGLRGWTIIFHNSHPHNQNNYHPQK